MHANEKVVDLEAWALQARRPGEQKPESMDSGSRGTDGPEPSKGMEAWWPESLEPGGLEAWPERGKLECLEALKLEND